MEALTLLLERNSMAQLQAPGPDERQLEVILQAGLRAPDHGGLHPWCFLLAQGEGRVRLGQHLAAAARRHGESPDAIEKAANAPLRAPLVITVVAKTQHHPKVPVLEQQLSAGCAVMAMQLAAQAQGLGGIWRSGWAMFDRGLHHDLGLGEEEQIVGFLYLGTPAGEPKRLRPLESLSFVRQI
ncbi:MAG: NAD(P)H nitroreductase [Aeromonadaceae bacterium]